jgi:hypothetical protein
MKGFLYWDALGRARVNETRAHPAKGTPGRSKIKKKSDGEHVAAR